MPGDLAVASGAGKNAPRRNLLFVVHTVNGLRTDDVRSRRHPGKSATKLEVY